VLANALLREIKGCDVSHFLSGKEVGFPPYPKHSNSEKIMRTMTNQAKADNSKRRYWISRSQICQNLAPDASTDS